MKRFFAPLAAALALAAAPAWAGTTILVSGGALVSAQNPLPVASAATQSGAWSVGLNAGSNTIGGVTLPDLEGAITPASAPNKGVAILGQYNPLVSLPTLTTGQTGVVQTDVNGRLLLSPSGITIQAGTGTSGATGGLDFGAAVATPQVDTAGNNYPLTLDPYGNLRTAPSPSFNALSTPINIATATTTQLVGLVANEKIYVTNLDVIAGGAGNITFEYGTGTNCGTGTTALTGPYPLAAQAGLSMGSGTGAVLVVPAGNALCALTSAAVQMSGSVAYQQY